MVFSLLFLAAPDTVAQDDWEQRVDKLFSEYDRPEEPGCSVGIVRDGQLVYAKGFGAANLEYDAPNTPQTLFELASFSKAFTSLCVAILLDRGTIDADDDVRQYVPELHEFDPPIRIRHLLTCHSGLWAQVHIMPLAGWDNMPIPSSYSEEDFLAILTGQRSLPFEPGAEFRYGSSDFVLLGLIVKRATGESLPEFARKNVFEPLGMSRTFYQEDPTRIVKNRAMPHHKLPDARGPWHQWPVNAYVRASTGSWARYVVHRLAARQAVEAGQGPTGCAPMPGRVRAVMHGGRLMPPRVPKWWFSPCPAAVR